MKRKWVRKGKKWKKRFTLDVEDWVTIFVVVYILMIAFINLSLRG